MFDAKIYIERRKKLKEFVGSGILLFPGNNDVPMNYPANQYHFRQDSSFLYFFGIDEPGFNAVIDIDEDKTTLFGDDFEIDDIIWMGDQPTVRERAKAAGVEHIASFKELESYIKKNNKRKIHYLPPYRADVILMISNLLEISPERVKKNASLDLIKSVVSLREKKSVEEIEEIEKAVNITREMHITAMRMAKPGIYERDIAGAIEGIALSRGANISFPVILTVHGETLHNHYHGNKLEEGRLIINDSGAESLLHYAGDITRTFPAGKKFTQKQKDIYMLVYNAQKSAIDSLKPGIRYKDVHLIASKTFAEGLKDLGLMKGNPEDAVSEGAHALFFPHGLGHMMGLDVHDMENLGEDFVGYKDGIKRSSQFGLAYLRLAKELEPGYVFTVEPGLYFIPKLIDLWREENKFIDFINYEKLEEYKDFGGVRIEDDYLITETGARLLGEPIPKTVEEIENIRSSAY
jgi:Xaa-Pro aminopeptidase